jgi:hypothetical protein
VRTNRAGLDVVTHERDESCASVIRHASNTHAFKTFRFVYFDGDDHKLLSLKRTLNFGGFHECSEKSCAPIRDGW